MRKISRSSHELFDECRRKGYWGSIYKGGLQEVQRGWPLVIGLAVHKGMELLMLGLQNDDQDSIDGALDAVAEEFRKQAVGQDPASFPFNQNLALAQALLLGWIRTRMEEFNARYEVISVEREVRTLLAPNILLQSRVDVVVRDRTDGSYWVFNWKTTGDMKDWTSKWEDDIQAWTEVLATQENLGVHIEGCIFEGFYKGGVSQGLSTSPLVCGYQKRDGTYTTEYSKRGEGAKKLHPWIEGEFPGGLEGWINFLPEEVVAEQFIRSHPILKNDEQVRLWLKQVVREETDIEGVLDPEVSEEDRLTFFKQHKGRRCRWCQFRPACRGEVSIDDMLADGQLVVREDHHSEGGN